MGLCVKHESVSCLCVFVWVCVVMVGWLWVDCIGYKSPRLCEVSLEPNCTQQGELQLAESDSVCVSKVRLSEDV